MSTVEFPETGEYQIYVRTKDWVARWKAPGQPGRFLLIDGEPLKETFGTSQCCSGNGIHICWRHRAAFLLPLTTRRNIYCTHLCPHGAAQQLLKHRVPWRIKLPRWLSRTLLLIPALLLTWCVIVALTSLPFSLVDIEPFDAWVFRVAGWATITIAIVGLVASLFVPMAYCRFGCPTGALLNYLRFNSRSNRLTRRDWVAMGLVVLALCLWGI